MTRYFSITIVLCLVLVGCGDETVSTVPSDSAPDDNGSDTSDTSLPPEDPCETPVTETDTDGNLYIMAEASQNYSFSSTMTAETIKVRSSSNLHFDWSDVTTDMFGRPFDPLSGVDMVEVLLWRYAKDDLLRDINDDNLDQGRLQAVGLIKTENTITSGNYLDVSPPGGSEQPDEVLMEYMDVDIYPPEDHSYLFMLAEGTALGKGTRMLVFFDLDPDEENTEVRLSDSSTRLDFEVDISSLHPIAIPPGRSDIVFDWIDESGALGTNAMGAEWVPNRILTVMIAHYADATVEDLEANFLDLEELADETWSIMLSTGQSVNLSFLENEDGEAFEGIDETGTWIITLICGSCSNPAPWFLSVLHPCTTE